MKTALLLLCAMLTGCGASAIEVLVPVQPAPQPSAMAVATAAPFAPPVVAVVRHFDRVKLRELDAISAPRISAVQIERIRSADSAAREALSALTVSHAVVTKGQIEVARIRVAALEATLETALNEDGLAQ